jgi:hypothetical protein
MEVSEIAEASAVEHVKIGAVQRRRRPRSMLERNVLRGFPMSPFTSSFQQFTAALSEIDEVVAALRQPLHNPFREFDHALWVLDKLIAELNRPPSLETTRQGQRTTST